MSQVKITHLSCILNIVRIIGVLIIIETMIFLVYVRFLQIILSHSIVNKRLQIFMKQRLLLIIFGLDNWRLIFIF